MSLILTSMWSKCLSNNAWRDFRLPMSALARKSLNGKFTALIFQFGIFCYHEAGIESQKSLQTLFQKYLDHMMVTFEQNRMVRNRTNFELF